MFKKLKIENASVKKNYNNVFGFYGRRSPPSRLSLSKYIHASAADLLYITLGDLDWC